MLHDFLTEQILLQLGLTPTPSQKTAADELGHFLASDSKDTIFLLTGYAGTGKTTLVRSVIAAIDVLKHHTVLLAPTGRAAKVLGNSTGKPAYTIHKKIYRQQSSKDGFAAFDLNKNLHKDTLFVVDEASMIDNSGSGAFWGSGRLLDDLMKYVYEGTNCRLLLIGDDAQLPPVGISISPALEPDTLAGYGLTVYTARLTHVVRQKMGSGILKNATLLRELLDQPNPEGRFPQFMVEALPDVHRITGNELIDELDSCYGRYGLEETLVICRTNKRANQFNQGIRNSILALEEELTVGDFLLVMKNNYHWLKENDEVSFIANGDIAEVLRINRYHSLYGFRFADVVCRLVDYKEMELDVCVMLDSLMMPGPGMTQKEQEVFFYQVMNDYQDEPNKKKQFDNVRENSFYNALQVKFAYAITCHKSQGGQWKAVFVDLGYFREEYLNRDFLRWLYTAITRATERLYLVNFTDRFFERI